MRAFSTKLLLPAIAAVGMLQAAPAQAEIKVGVLNFGRLIEESPQGKALFETLGNEAAAKRRDQIGRAHV